MSRNSVVTPEGPGQGQSSSQTDLNSPNTIHDMIVNKQFLQYPVYPPIYHYPLPQPIPSLLTIPPTIPPIQHLSQHPSTNNKSRDVSTNHHQESSSNNKKLHQNPLAKCKPKTVDLSRNNSRGELETLLRWIGGDSMQIKHHCSQESINNHWHCVCTVPLPFKTTTNTLKTSASHSKKKDAIKLASKQMIQAILKQPLPIPIDIIGDDGTVTSIAAQIDKDMIQNEDSDIDENSDDGQCDTNTETITPKRNTSVHKDMNDGWNKHKHKNKSGYNRCYSGHNHMRGYRGAPAPPPPYDYDPYSGPPPFPPYGHPHSYYHHDGDWCYHHHAPPSHYPSYAPYHPHQEYYRSYPYHCSPYRSRAHHPNHSASKHGINPRNARVVPISDGNNHKSDVDETSTVGDDIKDEEQENEYLFANEHEHEHEHSSHDHETDDGVVPVDITPKDPKNNSPKNPSMLDEDEDEYMNELKEEEIAPQNQKEEEKITESKPVTLMRDVTNPNPNENENENDIKTNTNNNYKTGEEKEMEGGFAVPPQRLLVLVPSQIEYLTIQSILPQNTQVFTFSKKLDIAGLVVPAFTHLPASTEQESMQSMQEAPGEQNRLYIVQCGTGLVNVSVSIATVVQTVHIDAILLLGSAISLQPKSIKPGHLLLPNTVIQHDLCINDRNNAIFKTNCKLSQWLRALITKGSGKENESLPVMYRGTLLSGSEIVKSESRISYLAKCTSNEDEEEEEVTKDGDIDDIYYDEAMAVDRESVSVAIICRTLRVPFVILKSIAPPKFDSDIDFTAYDDTSSNNASFDCNSTVPLLKALLEEYRMFDY